MRQASVLFKRRGGNLCGVTEVSDCPARSASLSALRPHQSVGHGCRAVCFGGRWWRSYNCGRNQDAIRVGPTVPESGVCGCGFFGAASAGEYSSSRLNDRRVDSSAMLRKMCKVRPIPCSGRLQGIGLTLRLRYGLGMASHHRKPADRRLNKAIP